MDDYRDMDETIINEMRSLRKRDLTEIKAMVKQLQDDNVYQEKLPSREMIGNRLGAIMHRCDEAIGED